MLVTGFLLMIYLNLTLSFSIQWHSDVNDSA